MGSSEDSKVDEEALMVMIWKEEVDSLKEGT